MASSEKLTTAELRARDNIDEIKRYLREAAEKGLLPSKRLKDAQLNIHPADLLEPWCSCNTRR